MANGPAEGETQNGGGPPRYLFKLRGPLVSHYLRPLFYLSRNLISRAGVVVTSTAAITLLVTFAFGSAANPYLGIVVYLVLPGVFAFGLIKHLVSQAVLGVASLISTNFSTQLLKSSQEIRRHCFDHPCAGC